jgi:hypothetical protein
MSYRWSIWLFDVRKPVHHHTIQIIQPTRCNSLTSLLLDIYVWLKMFRASPRPSSGAYNCTRSLWFNRCREVAGAAALQWLNQLYGCICNVISTGYTSSGISTNCVFWDMISGLYGSGRWAVQRNLTFRTGTKVTYQLVMLVFMSTLYIPFSI